MCCGVMGFSGGTILLTPANVIDKSRASMLAQSTGFFFKKTGKGANPSAGYWELGEYLRLTEPSPITPANGYASQAVCRGDSFF